MWWSRRANQQPDAQPELPEEPPAEQRAAEQRGAEPTLAPTTQASERALDTLYDLLITLHDVLVRAHPDAVTVEGRLDLQRLYPIVQRVAELRSEYALALLAYFDVLEAAPDRRFTSELIVVDRILTAYTYHLRLFPLRRVEDAGIVLGMLHDIQAKVVRALQQMEGDS
jgi:hypothetical protein